MKVLHLFKSYLPPSQQWAFNLIKHLPDVENHIAARHYLQHNFYDEELHYCQAPLDGLIAWDHSTSWNRWQNWLPKLWIKASQKILQKEMSNVIRYALEYKVDILHAHFGPTAWLFLPVAQKTGLPLVISFYGYDYQYKVQQQPAYKKRYQLLFQKAAIVTAEGPHGASQLVAMGCPEEKVKVVPLGVDVEAIQKRTNSKLPNSLKLLQIASYTRKKGHIHTVKAFARALLKCPNMHLTLVGDEREAGVKQEVLGFIEAQKLNDKVTLLDWIDYRQLHPFMASYDVFIHPSRHTELGDCEGGAPTILLDAMAVGLPVISTRHCDIPFVVGEAGRLVEEGDVEGLADVIVLFYEMVAEQYEDVLSKAREKVEFEFNVLENGALLQRLYYDIM